jgi:hypothetical protein
MVENYKLLVIMPMLKAAIIMLVIVHTQRVGVIKQLDYIRMLKARKHMHLEARLTPKVIQLLLVVNLLTLRAMQLMHLLITLILKAYGILQKKTLQQHMSKDFIILRLILINM